MKFWELVCVVLSAVVAGMFLGPWLALTRSIKGFPPELFLAVVQRLNTNMAPVMTFLMPVALVSTVPVLLLGERQTFFLTLAGAVLFVVALLVTVLIEVPIVQKIVTWTVATLPSDWERLRDRWGAFHLVRIAAALGGFVLIVAGAIF